MTFLRGAKIIIAMLTAFLGVLQAATPILGHVWGGLLLVLVGATMAALQIAGQMLGPGDAPPAS
jgi:fatty acid desaturase